MSNIKEQNKLLLNFEKKNGENLETTADKFDFLYPNMDDPNFNIKIANKKEFIDTKYDGTIYDVEKYSEILNNADFELLPQQAFVKNFLSFQRNYQKKF